MSIDESLAILEPNLSSGIFPWLTRPLIVYDERRSRRLAEQRSHTTPPSVISYPQESHVNKALNPVERTSAQPENPFASLIPDQQIAIVPSFTLESGDVLQNVPVAYSTRGTLSEQGDNAIVICHALSGSADVSDWWGPLMGGSGRAFDVTRFFVVCLNSLGSPYGTASPVTNVNGDPQLGQYGPEFPLTTIRDDVQYVLPSLCLRVMLIRS